MNLKSEFINKDPNAPAMLIFGGNPEMRDHVVRMLEKFGKVTVYAALSEEEGLIWLKNLPKINFVLIGGRYNAEEKVTYKKLHLSEFARSQYL